MSALADIRGRSRGTTCGHFGSDTGRWTMLQSQPVIHNRWETIMEPSTHIASRKIPWNKGKLVGQKAPVKLKDIWAIRVRLQIGHRTRELALYGLICTIKVMPAKLHMQWCPISSITSLASANSTSSYFTSASSLISH